MTADDTTADGAAAIEADGSADPGHGRRALARIGSRAVAAWIAEASPRSAVSWRSASRWSRASPWRC